MKLDDYKEEILTLFKDGNSSVSIAQTLSKKHNIKFHDRTIRKVLTRWGARQSPKDIHKGNTAKILIFDLETSHVHARVWGLWNQNINHTDIIRDWILLSWSAKWLFEDQVYFGALDKKELKRWKKDNDNKVDLRIVKSLWTMIDEADIIIGHNLIKFDRKKMNYKFLLHRLGLPKPYQMVDTLLVARKQFGNISNRLDFLGQYLDLGGKADTEKGLWNKVEEGDMEAMTKMVEYNIRDVEVLEDVYLELRPWIQPSPNIGLFTDGKEMVCTACGSTDLRENGEYKTTVNVFQNYTCNSCGHHSRGRKTLLLKDTSRNLLSSNPK